jgi:FlaA1/EpsC-like NDP-sugar epimerase
MRNRYILLIDFAMVTLAMAGAFVLRLDWMAPLSATHPFADAVRFSLVAAPLIKLPTFYLFGLYSRFWRYVALSDLISICTAVSVASVLFSAATLAAVSTGLVVGYPRSVPAIDWVLTLLAVAGVRVAVRVFAEARTAGRATARQTARRHVLIVGAGEAGAMVVRELERNPQLGLIPVGFLDDDAAKLGKKIHQVRVLGRLDQLADVVAAHEVDEVVIAMPTAPGATVREVVESARAAGVAAKALPGIFELLDGGVSVNRLRNVDIADLLRRRQITAAPDTARYLSGQVVLVTGAGGSIGSELCRQICHADARALVLVGHGENSIYEISNQVRQSFPAVDVHAVIADVRDRAGLARVFAAYRPSAVFHAAAHKHVPLMEAHPAEAITNNVVGTATLVDVALEAGVSRFVLVSTDKAVGPSSVMGATKRLAEMIVRDAAVRSGQRYLAVRFGNVLGSRGSVVPFFRRQIERGGPVTITHPDMTRFFMTIPEAVYLVLKAGGLARGGELFVLNMGEPVRIVDLATDLIRLSGFDTREIPIVFTGLRPGEKMAEELWERDSRVEPVGEGDVFRVQEPDPPLSGARLQATIDALTGAAARGDSLEVHRLLSDAIPSFVSSLHPTR